MAQALLGGKIHRTDFNFAARWDRREKDRLLDRYRIMKRQEGGGKMKGREFNAMMSELNGLLLKGGGHFVNKNRLLQETPLQIARKVDRVVSAGLNWMAQLGTGETTTSFSWMQAGDGTGAESAGDTALGNRLASSNLATTGTRFSSGNDMKFSGFFDETSASGTYSEFGVSTSETTITLLNRTLLAVGDRITFVNGDDVMTLTSIILGTGS